MPLTYLEAGLLCTPHSLYMALKNGYLILFVMVFMYGVMPFLAKLGTYLLIHSKVNIWLLKGMEVNINEVHRVACTLYNLAWQISHNLYIIYL